MILYFSIMSVIGLDYIL